MKNILKKLATSKLMDLAGIIMIILVAYFSGYLFETLDEVTHWGGSSVYIPFGFISVAISCLSILSTRLLSRLNNAGNMIAIPEIILACMIDYMLGNKGAIITYPVTFLIQAYALKKWTQSKKYEVRKPIQGGKFKLYTIFASITIVSLGFSFLLNYVAFGDINSSNSTLFILTVIVFGISITANILNALKFREQWTFWLVYDVIQLLKAFSQFNFANVGKYIYYIVMALAGNEFWKDT